MTTTDTSAGRRGRPAARPAKEAKFPCLPPGRNCLRVSVPSRSRGGAPAELPAAKTKRRPLKLAIIGKGILADAVAHDCSYFFDVQRAITHGMDAIWVCHETPVASNGEPNIPGIIQTIVKSLRPAPKGSVVIVSSQLRAGTTRALEGLRPDLFFVHIPENIRVAHARDDFYVQARIVVGRRTDEHDNLLLAITSAFTNETILTDPETAEFSKSALNSLLALQIAYVNELAVLCAAVGANAETVSQSLLLDYRVSPLAPLWPGAPYANEHLGREVCNLAHLARQSGASLPIIENIAASNNR